MLISSTHEEMRIHACMGGLASLRGSLFDQRGQGTVEAAFAIPVILVLVLLLVQPGIILYDYIVMRGTAVEACRLVATTNTATGRQSCIEFIEHRLSAIPQHDLFHVHDGECSWFIQVDGGEQEGTAEVWIENEVRPLPLFDGALRLLGMTNEKGNLEVGVSWFSVNQPEWVGRSVSGGPEAWVDSW